MHTHPISARAREIFERSFTVWSDDIYRVERVISEGDTVAAEVHWTGVHTGELVGTIDRSIGRIPSTGKRVGLVDVWIVGFKDEKVQVYKIFYNPNMVIQQLQE